VKPKRVVLWTARAADLDFRPVTWTSTPMSERGGEYVAELQAPATGGLAAFAEAEYETEGRSFTLSTPTSVYGKRPQ
jgi:hypothetical protein